ncbi:MAG: beta-ketoacyl-[acyl-carrier-protein] synthase family protein [bacterium]
MDVKMGRSVVVTGAGLVTPLGSDCGLVWRRLATGESGATTLPDGPLADTGARYCCPVIDAEFPRNGMRHISFALHAVESAIADAGLDVEDCRDGMGVSIGSSKGGFAALEDACNAFHRFGLAAIEDSAFELYFARTAASAVAGQWRLKGPMSTPGAACATGAHAILIGRRMIMMGEAEVVVAGAADSCITPLLLSGYRRMGALAVEAESPTDACKPYDARRSGFVLGEGCGIVILEEQAHALARGARIRAALKGGAAGEDVFHITAPDPSGIELGGVISTALGLAGVKPYEIDYVNTHGTGTRLNDPAETNALKIAFGDTASQVSFSSTKPMTGHCLGAAGSVEFIIALMALEHGLAPPTINLREPDPHCDLDYTPLVARRRKIRNVASISCGFGGHIGVLVAGRQKW